MSSAKVPSILRVDLSDTPLVSEHRHFVEKALLRGKKDLSAAAFEPITGFSERALEGARSLWGRRMIEEHHSSAVWARLLPQLIAAGAPMDFKMAALKASLDELHHATLCGEVLRALGAEPAVETTLETRPLPEHRDCGPRERLLRNVLFVGCMAETLAVALTSEERQLATPPLLCAVLDQIHADETNHGRYGWLFLAHQLPQLDAAGRERVAAYVPVALAHLERDLFEKTPAQPPPDEALQAELAALGVSENNAARTLFTQTVEQVIVPQLEAYGLPAADAWQRRND